MKSRLIVVLMAVLIVSGMASPALALQHGYAYAGIDLNSFSYSSDAFAGRCGIVSGAVAYAGGANGSDFDYDGILNSWAQAYATGAWATSGINADGYLTAAADASAGGANGEESAAFAAGYAIAYQVWVPEAATFTIDYYLNGTIDGDTDYGYSSAGSGALLAVLGADGDSNGNWLDIEGGFGTDDYLDQSFLSLTLSKGLYTIFAGTAAFASATEAFASGTGTAAPVPEPATMLLLGTGLIGLAGLGRKKQVK